MSPRPRKASDDDILAATYRAMTRLGPGELTLAEIAAEAGVTASAVAQRFGSKRQLLLTLAERAAAASGDLLAELRAASATPLAAVREYTRCMAGMAASPASLARSLAYLQIDLTDPDFRAHLLRQAEATRAGLERLLAEALDAGELRPGTSPAVLARSVEAVIGGSMLMWGFYREGTAAEWMVQDLDALLAPHRVEASAESSTSGKTRRSKR